MLHRLYIGANPDAQQHKPLVATHTEALQGEDSYH